MRLLGLLLITALCSLSACKKDSPRDPMLNTNVLIPIRNMTQEPGYFDVCNDPIPNHPTENGVKTKCNIPEPIKKGENMVFVPKLATAYPVFIAQDEQIYTCQTEKNLGNQIHISTLNGFQGTLVLGPFILDKDQNKIAISCSRE